MSLGTSVASWVLTQEIAGSNTVDSECYLEFKLGCHIIITLNLIPVGHKELS